MRTQLGWQRHLNAFVLAFFLTYLAACSTPTIEIESPLKPDYTPTTVAATTVTEEIRPAMGKVRFRSDKFYLEVTLPSGWAAVEGPEYLAHPFTGLVTFNSWGDPSFWAPEVKTTTSQGTHYTYSPESTLGQIPPKGAYVVLVQLSGGPAPTAEEYGPEYERQDLSGLWDQTDCREGKGTSYSDFFKWGRILRLEVYCDQNASAAVAAEVNALLSSWRFDQVPVDDIGWAVVEARRLLPPGVEPTKFPVLASLAASEEPLQALEGEATVARITRAAVRGETVVVMFMYHWDEPWTGSTFEDCPPDRCHWWRFEARPSGEVVMIEEGGPALPGAVTTSVIPIPTPTLNSGKLAYVQKGNIWIRKLPDGKPQQLTIDGLNHEPRWSPSGQWLAFRKEGGQVWVVRDDGSAARPLHEGDTVDSFAWVPLTDRLAYTTAQGKPMVVDADGSNRQELVPVPGIEDENLLDIGPQAWSPNGEWLAYVREEIQKEAQSGYPPERSVSLWRIDTYGSGATELYNAGAPAQDGLIVAGWSQDSQYILFWLDPYFSASILADGVPLYAIPVSGGEPRQLDEDMLLHVDFWESSPDGKQLAITEGGGRETWTHKRIAIVDLASGRLIYLTDKKVAAFSPAWSPDGQRIAYSAAPDIGNVGGGDEAKAGAALRRIWIMNSDGSNKRQLTADAVYRDERPLWSADGSHILFARLDAQDQASLWLVPAEGGEPRRVVDELMLPQGPPASAWFGYYGHINWDLTFDWWRGPVDEMGKNISPLKNLLTLNS